jgi:hypothetical protein
VKGEEQDHDTEEHDPVHEERRELGAMALPPEAEDERDDERATEEHRRADLSAKSAALVKELDALRTVTKARFIASK